MRNQEKKKPKVLFILHLPPPIYGATIANVYIQNSILVNTAFDSTYINLATNTKLKDVGKATLKKPLMFILMVFKVIKALLKDKYSACWVTLTATGPAFYKDLIIVSVLKLFNANIVYFMHNKGVSNASKNSFKQMLYRYAFRNTKVILSSKHLYQDVQEFVDERNVYYCPLGIPETRVEQAPQSLFDKVEKCRLLFLGNLMREKGVLVLLEACNILKERNIAFTCSYVGGWSDVPELEFNDLINKYGLGEEVILHGPKYNTEKVWFLENSDIFVFPTYYHYETFGMVNLEAMEYGLPIISTPEGGIPDLVIDGTTGYLVPQRNAVQLADKIEILIADAGLRKKMGEYGRHRFKTHYTLEKYEAKVVEVLSSVIGRGNDYAPSTNKNPSDIGINYG